MKDTKYKNSYLGVVSDVIPYTIEQVEFNPPISFDESPTKEELEKRRITKQVVRNEYRNRKDMLFCSCGHSFVVNLKFKTKKVNRKANPYYKDSKSKIIEIQDDTRFEAIKCNQCEKEYSDYTNLSIIGSKLYQNCISLRYVTFVSDDKIRLVKFKTFVGVNQYSRRLYFIDKSESICYNRNTKRFFITYGNSKKNRITHGVGIRNAKQNFSSIIENSLDDKVAYNIKNTIPINKDLEKELIEPLNKFLKELNGEIDKRDSERVFEYIETSLFSKDKIDEIIKYNKDKDYWDRATLKNRYLDSLSVVTSIIQFPSMTTILFTKGPEFINEIANSENFPRPSFLKRNNPTSPRKILEEILKQGLEQHYVMTTKKRNPQGKVELKKRKENIKNFNLRQSLNRAIIKKSDLLILSFLFERGFDEDYFYNLCDIYGTREILDVFFSMYGNSINSHNFHSIVEFNYEKLKHIIKVFKKIEGEESTTEIFFPSRIENGNGAKKQFDMCIYNDTIRIADDLGLGENAVYECKTWDEVVDFHDEIVERAKLLKVEEYNNAIKRFAEKYKKLKLTEIDGVKFSLISNVIELEKESQDMKHCVKSYARGIAEGRHLIFSVTDTEDDSRATLEFYRVVNLISDDDDEWNFSQLKAKFNKRATNKIIDSVFKFCKEKLEKEKVKYNISDYSKNNGDLKIIEESEEDLIEGDWLF